MKKDKTMLVLGVASAGALGIYATPKILEYLKEAKEKGGGSGFSMPSMDFLGDIFGNMTRMFTTPFTAIQEKIASIPEDIKASIEGGIEGVKDKANEFVEGITDKVEGFGEWINPFDAESKQKRFVARGGREDFAGFLGTIDSIKHRVTQFQIPEIIKDKVTVTEWLEFPEWKRSLITETATGTGKYSLYQEYGFFGSLKELLFDPSKFVSGLREFGLNLFLDPIAKGSTNLGHKIAGAFERTPTDKSTSNLPITTVTPVKTGSRRKVQRVSYTGSMKLSSPMAKPKTVTPTFLKSYYKSLGI